MLKRRSSVILSGVGLILIALGLVVRFVVLPYAAQLPEDTDVTLNYTGTATMLNPIALNAGDFAPALAKDVPILPDRRVPSPSTDNSAMRPELQSF